MLARLSAIAARVCIGLTSRVRVDADKGDDDKGSSSELDQQAQRAPLRQGHRRAENHRDEADEREGDEYRSISGQMLPSARRWGLGDFVSQRLQSHHSQTSGFY